MNENSFFLEPYLFGQALWQYLPMRKEILIGHLELILQIALGISLHLPSTFQTSRVDTDQNNKVLVFRFDMHTCQKISEIMRKSGGEQDDS